MEIAWPLLKGAPDALTTVALLNWDRKNGKVSGEGMREIAHTFCANAAKERLLSDKPWSMEKTEFNMTWPELLNAADVSARLWEVETGIELKRFKTGDSARPIFTPDSGKLIAPVFDERVIKVLNVESGDVVRILKADWDEEDAAHPLFCSVLMDDL